MQLRLISQLKEGGISGINAGAIELIYAQLLKLNAQNSYSFILINQIGDALDEFVMVKNRELTVNIRMPSPPGFATLSEREQNLFRLHVIHSALLRVSKSKGTFDINVLNKIQTEIESNDFSYEFVLRKFINRRTGALVAKLIVSPKSNEFQYFISIDLNGKEICRHLIYQGLTHISYINKFFKIGKWIKNESIIISGTEGEIETHVSTSDCSIKQISLTKFKNPPLFEMLKSHVAASTEEKALAIEDWRSTLTADEREVLRKARAVWEK